MNVSERDLKRQFDRIRQSGWLNWFQDSARRHGFTTAHLLALGSRETNLKNIRGDFRGGDFRGFGVLQVDIGTDPAYCRAWTPANVEPSIRRGAEILAAKLSQTVAGQGRTLSVRGRAFKGKSVDPDDARRIATAAYNCGLWAFYHFSRGENVDSTTTGDDYSRDVYDRAILLAAWLDSEGIEPGAEAEEVRLQGKYARASVREKAFPRDMDSVAALPERVKLPPGEAQESEEALTRASYRRDDDEPETPATEVAAAETGVGGGGEGAPGGGETTGQPPGSPAAAAAPKSADATTVTVPQAKPEEDRPADVISSFKARYAALPAGVISYLSAAYLWARSAPAALIGALVGAAALIVVAYVVAYMMLKNKREARADALKLQRERQAHEITLKQIETAASRNLNTVRVVPNPVSNSDSAP